ncbi:fimbrial protein [Aeromonas caviae]|uniref:fimbrial protein n=1 Tax=Aeromonas caviae TaxID=648 RepID=UPI0029DD7352|nr:fimbrial protein [Aeromonas caviae]MDX7871221.1 fimbrial protein [Aeromonas caviae]
MNYQGYKKPMHLIGVTMKKICRITLMIFSALLTLSIISEANAAPCTAVSVHPTAAFMPKFPKTLSLPRDTPNGTVVWRESITDPISIYTCNNSKIGIKNYAGAQVSSGTILPIGTTGLGYRWSGPAGIYNPFGLVITSQNQQMTFGGSQLLEILKIGEIATGATVPAGFLAAYEMEGKLLQYILVQAPIVVTPLSCTTSDVSVPMGIKEASGFSGINTRLTPKAFEINLSSCPAGIKSVKYRLDAKTSILNQAESVIALSAGSTAVGVGVQILDNMDKPLPLGVDTVFSNYVVSGGDFSIPLKAAYYQTANNTKGGTANTSLTFTMTYL